MANIDEYGDLGEFRLIVKAIEEAKALWES